MAEPPRCLRTLRADIVAIDQPLMFNRLGAQNINGMMFALKRDVVDDSEPARPLSRGGAMRRGHVYLRPDKRPRPLVLRVAEGDCLDITLTSLLTTQSNPREPVAVPPTTLRTPLVGAAPGAFPAPRFEGGVDDQVADRMVGFHVQGMQLREGVADDAAMVGLNPSGLVAPGGTITYHLYAEHEGTYLATSHGATFGGDATSGNSANGLFGAVNVEPLNARFYRSQLTEEELRLAASADGDHVGGQGPARKSGHDQPVVDYEATYPNREPWIAEGKAGLPILNMLSGDEIVHSDINAIIAGPDADGGWWSKCPRAGDTPPLEPAARKVYDNDYKYCPYPLEKVGRTNPSLPKRLEPFREFTVIFHDEMSKTNAFPQFYAHNVKDKNGADVANPLAHTLKAVGDVFMINYGSGGIGSEIIANRLGVGPMHDCLGCAAEEFFLTSHVVGDPAMIVDVPANFGLDACRPVTTPDGNETHLLDCDSEHKTIVGGDASKSPLLGPKATRALYPDDPSNVHHSYISDHVKFRNLHTGKEHHIFHLHNHQWLYNPNDDNANYLDAQAIGPGSGYTYEINFGGSGNRNKSAGDAIFHCHLYPHFAQGMWELWRNHDVLETGTPLEASGGLAAYHKTAFALQDGMPARDPGDANLRMRALPDGEIAAGTPIPAVVPLPGKAMAPMPGKVNVVARTAPRPLSGSTQEQQVLGSVAHVDRTDIADKNRLTREEMDANEAKTPLGNVLNPNAIRNPGFPFWIAGIEHSVGQRPPTPPLDMLPAEPAKDGKGDPAIFRNGGWDGGLPRHALGGLAAAKTVITDDKPSYVGSLTRYDLSKRVKVAKPIWFAEDGTDLEKIAMAFHAVREHPSSAVDVNGTVHEDNVNFITNGGGKPVPGAPFHNPCIDDEGKVLKNGRLGRFFDGLGTLETKGYSPFDSDRPRIYKGADIQFDAVINKAGWHFPQQRIIALWDDVRATISKAKAPEPLVMRNNTFDCTVFLHTNLVPEIYEWDDYQVRTSTDIIGQHIHLPKWDLTTTDGSGNGWNYEDGTLAPGAVRERIDAINDFNKRRKDLHAPPEIADVEGHPVYTSANFKHGAPIGDRLDPAVHPYFGASYPFDITSGKRTQVWKGARTTLQRWFFDPVVNTDGVHRGLGIIFTHDHFGPSTHQQVGLYATVLVEPAGSEWVHNETGEIMGRRSDGGPTSWQAIIRTGADQKYLVTDKDWKEKPATRDLDGDGEDDSYREFYLEYSDFQHAYLPGKYVGADPNGVITSREEKADAAPGEAVVAGFVPPLAANSGRSGVSAPKKDFDPYEPDETSYKFAINPPIKADVAKTNPLNLVEYAPACEIFGTSFKRPCAEAITADDPGTFVVNYRNEPVGLRIMDTLSGGQAQGRPGDLAHALQTFSTYRNGGALRAYKVANATFGSQEANGLRGVLNAQPREGDRIGGIKGVKGREPTCFPRPLQAKVGGPPIPSGDINHDSGLCQKEWGEGDRYALPFADDGDPFTPIMRAYDADRIRLKIQAGGDEETHNATVHGVKWLQGGSGYGFASNSGWRNSQQAGISEQFTFASPLLPFNNVAKLKAIDSLGSLKKKWERDEAERSKAGKGAAVIKSLEDDEDRREIDIKFHKRRDYLYSIDASTEGYWNGSWGLLRAYGRGLRDDLLALPNNPPPAKFELSESVCEGNGAGLQNLREFDISAVLANDVLDNKVGATLAPGMSVLFGKLRQQDGGALSGTLVYNPRTVAIQDADIAADPADGAPARSYKGHADGLLQDPTAIMYVYTSDLTTKAGAPPACMKDGKVAPDPEACPVTYLRLKEKAPVEPIVLRAAAGDCIEVTLRNLIGKEGAPDVITYRQLAPIIPRFPDNPDGTILNSNRIRTSSVVGLHPALVAFDVAAHDGTAVGINDERRTLADTDGKSGVVKYRWYAGDVSLQPEAPQSMRDLNKPRAYLGVHTPIEFGGVNLMPADKIKQGQKGLVGALVIEPQGSKWTGLKCKPDAGDGCLDEVADHQGGGGQRSTRLSTTVTKRDGSRFRDLVTVVQKGLTQLYGDGRPVEGIAAENLVAEDTEDSATMAINYGSEPLWYRFGLLPLLPFTGAKTPAGSPPLSFRDVPNAHEAYSESLAYKTKSDVVNEAGAADADQRPGDKEENSVKVSGEPAVPVLTAIAGEEMRMRVLQPAGNARGSVFNLHGHVWQRAPYRCPGSNYHGLNDVCPETGFFPIADHFEVGSRAIGRNPMSMYLGGQDSLLPAGHFDIVLPQAGGRFGVAGDYLYRDQASFGNLGGLWGVVRVRRQTDIFADSGASDAHQR